MNTSARSSKVMALGIFFRRSTLDSRTCLFRVLVVFRRNTQILFRSGHDTLWRLRKSRSWSSCSRCTFSNIWSRVMPVTTLPIRNDTTISATTATTAANTRSPVDSGCKSVEPKPSCDSAQCKAAEYRPPKVSMAESRPCPAYVSTAYQPQAIMCSRSKMKMMTLDMPSIVRTTLERTRWTRLWRMRCILLTFSKRVKRTKRRNRADDVASTELSSSSRSTKLTHSMANRTMSCGSRVLT
mmetsp:Transcript_31899/g.96451  ORF Transcript_31899/g.96451 Transcript_31899/m.96451 type:complete len:240 (+) Transcript_31899:1593-2312(+)